MSDKARPTKSDASGTAGGQPSPTGGWWWRYGALLKHWAIFLGILGASVAINQWRITWVNIHFAEVTAEIMGAIMRLLGQGGWVEGINITTDVCKFKIIGECTAFYPLSIYVAAVLAFPSPWMRRIVGVLVGVPVLLLVNQGRLVSLCFLYRIFPDQFDMIHLVVWQSLIIFFTVLVWILWVVLYAQRS